jgi:hypothetical protein
MTIAQLEHASIDYSDPLPSSDLFDRMENAARARRAQIVTAAMTRMKIEIFVRRPLETEQQAAERRAGLVNQHTQAELRRADIQAEMVEIARLIVAEADNASLMGDTA